MSRNPTFPGKNAEPDPTSLKDDGESSSTTPGAGSNWLWLAEIAHWNVTLELDFEAARLAADLRRHFAQVKFHRLESGFELPFRDATCDCVTLNGVLDRLLGVKSTTPAMVRRLIAECRRVLRPGGCLYVGTGAFQAAAPRYRWLSLLGSHRPLIADRLLRRAGFKSVHSYCVDPCLDRPYVMVPATRRSLLARERALAACGASDLKRMLAVRLGLPHALYPARIGLAYR